MQPKPTFLELHFAVLLLGATALFGKFLTVHPVLIIGGRSLFTVIALIIVMWILGIGLRIHKRRHMAQLALSGVLLALHWVAFFTSIQMSTVAIGVLGFATYPMFVTFLEPILFKEPLKQSDVFSAIGVMVGIILMVPEWEIGHGQTLALMIAILSGFLLACFTIVNRKFVKRHHFLQITFYQHFWAGLCVLPFVFIWSAAPNMQEWGLLALLGVVFTALPQALLVHCLSQIKAQLVSLSVGLEPVYSIVLAVFLLGEIPPISVVLGGGIILVSVYFASVVHLRSTNTKRA